MFSLGVKRARPWSWHLTPSGVEVKNELICTSISLLPHPCKAWTGGDLFLLSFFYCCRRHSRCCCCWHVINSQLYSFTFKLKYAYSARSSITAAGCSKQAVCWDPFHPRPHTALRVITLGIRTLNILRLYTPDGTTINFVLLLRLRFSAFCSYSKCMVFCFLLFFSSNCDFHTRFCNCNLQSVRVFSKLRYNPNKIIWLWSWSYIPRLCFFFFSWLCVCFLFLLSL